MPRKWTNASQPAGGYRLSDLENEMHRRWASRQQRQLERRLGITTRDFTTEMGTA